MNKGELITRIAENADLSIAQATEVMDTLLYTIGDTLRDGKKVSLFGFGTFISKERKSRPGRNPKTGEQIIIPAKKIVKFRPGKELEEILN